MAAPATPPRADQIVRRYLWSRRQRDRLARGLGAAFDGLWLGLLDRDRLHQLDERFYDDRLERVEGHAARYDDDAYNARGLFDWEDAAVQEHFPAGGEIVVTGAGGGREVLALLERGFDAIGYEPNRRFASAGADLLGRRGHPDRLRPSERDHFPADVERCDGIVVGWGSYMLIAGRECRIEFLRAARRCLSDGDPILLSFFAHAERPRYFAVVAGVANAVRRLRRRPQIELGDTIAGNFLHCFVPAEIEAELAAGGFDLVALELSPYAHAVGRAV
jgi:hypothetical protein